MRILRLQSITATPAGVTDSIVIDAFLYYSYDPASSGEVSRERMYELYRQNLALVLAYVDILLLNIDAEQAVVTADHGEGLGHRDVWSHPYGYPWSSSPIRTVPWAQTTAVDEGTYTSQYDELEETPLPDERKEMLKNIGYI